MPARGGERGATSLPVPPPRFCPRRCFPDVAAASARKSGKNSRNFPRQSMLPSLSTLEAIAYYFIALQGRDHAREGAAILGGILEQLLDRGVKTLAQSRFAGQSYFEDRGGLSRFRNRRIYLPKGSVIPRAGLPMSSRSDAEKQSILVA